MDAKFEIREILASYFSLLGPEELKKFSLSSNADPPPLAFFWEDALTTDREDGIRNSIIFYRALNELQRTPRLCLSYNEPLSLIYPWIVEKVFGWLSTRNQKKLINMAGAESIVGIAESMREQNDLRNAFRGAFLEDINDRLLSFLYSLVYLMGFSSGGESSFISRIFPKTGGWTGHILDAGGGSGFSGLVLSSRGPVTYIDFSPFRARRAEAIAQMACADGAFFDEMIGLINLESSVFSLSMKKESIPPLRRGEIVFRTGDLLHLPPDFGPFDGAVIADVLEHTKNPEGILINIAKTLRPGAPLLITVPTEANGTLQKSREGEVGLTFPFLLHIEFFSSDRIERMARGANLAIEEVAPYSYEPENPGAKAPMEVMVVMRRM